MSAPIYLLTYATSTAPSHGEPGERVVAIVDPTQIGYFTTREEAAQHADTIASLYFLPPLTVTEVTPGIHRTR